MNNRIIKSNVYPEKTRLVVSTFSPLLVFRNFLSYIILLFAISPYELFIANWIYAVLVFAWLFFTIMYDFDGFYTVFIGFEKKNWLLYSWIIYLLVESLIRNSQFPLKVVMTIFCLQMFWYYFDKVKILKRQIVCITIYLIAIIGNSIFKLIENPLISRELAGASFENAGVFMAGYSIIYSSVFIIPFLYFVLLTRRGLTKSKKIVLLTIIVAGSFMIVMAQYTIALILLSGLLIIHHLLFAKINVRINGILIILLVIFVSIVIIFPLIEDEVAISVGDKLNFLNNRINQLKSYVLGQKQDSDVLGIRPTLYRNSFDTFKENPIWGVGRNVQDKGIVGEHSEILDLLARHGLLGALFFSLSFGKNAVIIINNQREKITKMSIFITYIIFFLFLFLNPGLRLADGIALFYMIPAISRITEKRNYHKSLSEINCRYKYLNRNNMFGNEQRERKLDS